MIKLYYLLQKKFFPSAETETLIAFAGQIIFQGRHKEAKATCFILSYLSTPPQSVHYPDQEACPSTHVLSISTISVSQSKAFIQNVPTLF